MSRGHFFWNKNSTFIDIGNYLSKRPQFSTDTPSHIADPKLSSVYTKVLIQRATRSPLDISLNHYVSEAQLTFNVEGSKVSRIDSSYLIVIPSVTTWRWAYYGNVSCALWCSVLSFQPHNQVGHL